MSHLVRLAAAVLLVGLGSTTVRAAIILDTGTPNQTSNRSIFNTLATNNAAQILAQQFTLSTAVQLESIEVYLGGLSPSLVTMSLSTAIGPAATAANLIQNFILQPPGTAPSAGVFVSTAVTQFLPAGNYFLVFSSATSVPSCRSTRRA